MAVRRTQKAPKVDRARQRVGVVVLGMHRSGTSALTRVLNLLGCDLPKTLMKPNPTNEAGHWESEAVCRLNDRILESAGSSWQDWLRFNPAWFESPKADEYREEALATLQGEFGTSRFFVLKDPRNCRLLPFWLNVFERSDIQPLIFLPVRNPLEVAASLEKRNGFDPSLGQLMWLRNVLDAEAASRGIPRLFSSYDRLLNGWGSLAVEADAVLSIKWPRLSEISATEIESFLQERHRHHRKTPESVIDNPMLSSWLRETYSIMEGWATAGEKAPDRATLDRIRHEFDAASPAFGRLIADGQAVRSKAAQLEKTLAEESRKLDAAQALATASEQKAKDLGQALETACAKSAELENRLAALKEDLSKRSETIEAAEAARAQTQSEVAALEAAAAELRGRKETLEMELRAARQRTADADQAMAGEREQRAKLEAELAAGYTRLQQAEEELAGLRADVERRAQEALALERARADAEWRRGEIETLHAQEQKKASRYERELSAAESELSRRASEIVALRAELEEQSGVADAAEQAAYALRDELSQTRSALTQRGLEAEQTAAELEETRRELARASAAQGESERIIAGFREHVTLLIDDLKKRQSAYAALEKEVGSRRGREGEELACLREALQEAERVRGESERIAVGLKEHVELLRSDIETLRVEAEAQKKDRQRGDEELARLRQELAASRASAEAGRKHAEAEAARLKEEVQNLRSQKQAAEQSGRDEQARLESRLRERFDEIAALTRMTAEAERKAGRKDEAMEQMRASLAMEMGRTVSALLDGRSLRLLPESLRVRRQMALLRRSGLFDPEWYLDQYPDVAKEGADPLRHYVAHGAREGREPNRTLAELKGASAER